MSKKKWITPWKKDNKEYEPSNNMFGFIYLITFEDGSFYIGKKQRKVKRGKKKAKTSNRMMINWIEDWQGYKSSSEIVKERIKEGIIPKFEVLKECFIKGQLTYEEVRYQFEYDVLSDEKSLNMNINGKYYKDRVIKYKSLK